MKKERKGKMKKRGERRREKKKGEKRRGKMKEKKGGEVGMTEKKIVELEPMSFDSKAQALPTKLN